MSSISGISRWSLAVQLSLLIVAGGALGAPRTHAQTISFNAPFQLSDNEANQGSPTVTYSSSLNYYWLYYVNHSNNIIYADPTASGHPVSTGIGVYSAELTNVGAAYLNNEILISYVGSDQQVHFATSQNGESFGNIVTPSASELGTGSASPAIWCSPTLISNGSTVYVATVGTNGYVYISSTTDGQTFTPVRGNGVSVSSYQTVSQPALTIFNGSPWVAFTNGSSRYVVVGNATGTGATYVDNAVWGNSNRDGHYAGLAMVVVQGYLYIFGQDSASSQHLKEIYTSDGTNWSGVEFDEGIQLRWSPTVWTMAGYAYMVIQDDGNTNLSVTSN